MLTVLSYNILNGAKDPNGDRLPQIAKLIEGANADIVALQECKFFDVDGGKRLFELEKLLGMRSFLANADTGQHVAVLVRPSARIHALHVDTAHFHHALMRLQLHLQTGELLTVLATHLCPHGGENRIQEVQRICNYARTDERVILMGDLNSLDHRATHDEVIERLPSHYRARHLLPGSTHEVDTRVTRTLEAAGFCDVLAETNTAKATAPTKITHAGSEFSNMRVDYVYTTPPLLAAVKDSGVLVNETTDTASDHYPVFATFRDMSL